MSECQFAEGSVSDSIKFSNLLPLINFSAGGSLRSGEGNDMTASGGGELLLYTVPRLISFVLWTRLG